jgi:hypothetical protein
LSRKSAAIFEQQLQQSSVCVTMQIKIGLGKDKTCWFAWEKWFWICIFAHFAVAGTKHCKVS